MFNSNIARISAGSLNKVNDAAIGQITASQGPRASRFASQLGQGLWFDDSTVPFDSTMGTLYGGHYRYVRLAAAATAPAYVGQILFWDTIGNAADNLYQVTTSEAGSTDTAVLIAGICLNTGWSVGNYSWIQDLGPCYVKFRGTLTATGAPGSRVFAAAAGAGADLGLADVVDAGGAATVANVSQMLGRFLGIAQETPTSGGLKRVYLNLHNMRG